MSQQQSTPPPKPTPIPQQDNEFYWEKAKAHELWLRKCSDCNDVYFYPRDISPCCFSRNTEWIKASGKGTLYTWGITVRPPTPAFREDAPFVLAIVDLEEGCRIPTNLVGIPKDPDPEKMAAHITHGMAVEVAFEDRTDAISVPVFKPVGS